MDKGLNSRSEATQRPRQTRQATLQAAKSDRDHVRSSEGLATGGNAMRQIPDRVPVRDRAGRSRDLLAIKKERVLSLTNDMTVSMGRLP